LGNLCMACGAGSYQSASGAGLCDECGAGKYQSGMGMQTSADCLACAAWSVSSNWTIAAGADQRYKREPALGSLSLWKALRCWAGTR
jgi:hypothetical protein